MKITLTPISCLNLDEILQNFTFEVIIKGERYKARVSQVNLNKVRSSFEGMYTSRTEYDYSIDFMVDM